MSITSESGQQALKFNRKTLYYIPAQYKYINQYLVGALRETLFRVLQYLSNKQIIIDHHRYNFILYNKKLTYGVRKKAGGESTTSRHMNLLCALGFFTKRKQSDKSEDLLRINKQFKEEYPKRKRYINVYSFRRYTKSELERIEERARRLWEAEITTSNISYNTLAIRGLHDIGKEVFPNNNRDSPQKKIREYKELLEVMIFIIESEGYATREKIQDNLLIRDNEIKKLFKIFKRDLEKDFHYHKPTKEQVKKFNLESFKYIYTKRW